MTNFKLVFPFFLVPLFLSAQQEEVHYVQFPCNKVLVLGTNDDFEGGTYVEEIPDSEMRVQFHIVNGKREGDLFIFNNEDVLAQGRFENDELVDNTLNVYSEEGKTEIKLIEDAPFFMFKKHWRCQSGVTESDEDGNYIWIASKRYKLEEGITLSFALVRS